MTTTRKKASKPTGSSLPIPDDVLATIKEQLKAELLDELQSKEKLEQQRREEQQRLHAEYINKMKQSEDPWVEIVGTSTDADGRIEIDLEWNTPFIDYLKANNITGSDEEQIVQRWLTYLLKDVAETLGEDVESVFE